MTKRKDLPQEAVGAAVIGFLGGVAVGRYLIDEILSDEELKEIKKEGLSVLYRCPKCSEELKVGANFCSNCGIALEWSKRGKEP